MAIRQLSPSQTSIILVGQRGSGLSSFAIIAARLTRFEVIDVDALFAREHTQSRASCLRAWGEQRYCEVANQFFKDVLLNHSRNHVLVCASEAVNQSSHSLLRQCCPEAPVVMVNRDMSAIRQHPNLTNSAYSTHILQASQQLCRQASNIEFYNLAEDCSPKHVSDLLFLALRSHQMPEHSIRRLQNVTQDVTRFLGLLGYLPDGHSFSEPNGLEKREFPSYMTLHVEDILAAPLRRSDLDCSSDALELLVSCPKDGASSSEDIQSISEAFQILRRHHCLPIIYHVRFQPGSLAEARKRYLELCFHGLRLLPEYLTVDLESSDEDITALISAKPQCTKLMAHRIFTASEEFSWKDPSLFEQCRRAASLGCQHVRFIRLAVSPSEDSDCASFQILANAACNIAVSAVCIYEFAKLSLVASQGLVPVRPLLAESPSSAKEERALPTINELNSARFSSFIYQSLHFHVYGASVHYSMSPAMHNAAFEFHGLKHLYSSRQSPSLDSLRALFDDTFGGASISLPFKSDVLSFLNSVSEPARIIQAVNTILPLRNPAECADSPPQDRGIHRQKNRAGKILALHGENTDWSAILNCIRRRLSAANTITPSSTALVIGAGGMARASVFAIVRLGVTNIMIWNRTLSRAQQLVDHFTNYVQSQGQHKRWSCKFHIFGSLTDLWPNDMKHPSIIVCTPPSHAIGSKSGLDFKVPQQWFGSATGGVIVELSYLTKSTSLLEQAYEAAHRGWVVVEPLEVLIEQGCAQFELFVGRAAPRKEMTKSVIAEYIKS